jgi:preprotein translocase subunit SecB
MADEPAPAPATDEKQLLLQKIYIKDMSFESPKAPEIFSSNAQASTNLNIGSNNRVIDGDHVEVSLTLTITSKDGDETLFLIEIIQAGIFTITGYNEQERQALLGSFCPGTLYPFAREAVSDVVTRGGFPQLLLQPINFDALYQQAVMQRQAQAAAGGDQPIQVQVPGVETREPKPPGGGDTH